MHVLDQVYFSPVLQRKFKALARLKRRRHKMGKVANTKRQSGGGGGTAAAASSDKSNASTSEIRSQITTKANASKQLAESESSDSISSQSSTNSRTDVSNDSKQGAIKPVAPPMRKRKQQKKKVMQVEKGKPKTINRKMRIDRNLRLWLANRRIFIFRRKKVLLVVF